MKLSTILIYLIALQTAVHAQSTNIPDNNFEQKLIDLGVDDVLDGEVLTESIDTISSLTIPSSEITDMTGIEDFAALETLNCANNELTTLDLSFNSNIRIVNCSINELSSLNTNNCSDLEIMVCPINSLTAVDFSDNVSLITLIISQNELTALDVSNNANLVYLSCDENELTSLNVWSLEVLQTVACQENNLTTLDFSTNISLVECYVHFNNLSHLNLQNGNNLAICADCFSCLNNPDLNCIEVDDPDFSIDNWPNRNDHNSFSEDCGLSIDETSFATVNVYPNPANTTLNFHLKDNQATYSIYNTSGELLKKGELTNGSSSIDISELPSGLYSVHLVGENLYYSTRVVIQ